MEEYIWDISAVKFTHKHNHSVAKKGRVGCVCIIHVCGQVSQHSDKRILVTKSHITSNEH